MNEISKAPRQGSAAVGSVFGAAVVCSLLTALYFVPTSARAEQSGDAPCPERLRMFVLTIDALFSRSVRDLEAYYAAIREYLPDKGYRADEVLSISETSK